MALPARKLSYDSYNFADCLTWDEHDRIEIVRGEAVMMAPPSTVHQEIALELSRQLANYLQGKTCKAYIAPFGVRLFEEEGDRPEDVDTVVEPDISVVCDRSKIDKYGCRGAPDLVIEILSPSTRRHDKFTKYNLYQQAGVREYWIVDPDAKDIQTFLLEEGRYSAHSFGTAEDKLEVAVLEDCTLDLSLVFPEQPA